MSANDETAAPMPSRYLARNVLNWAALLATVTAVGLLVAPPITAGQGSGKSQPSVRHNDASSSDAPALDAGITVEAYRIDHSVVNKQNLPDEPNPAPMAIAAYD